MERPNTPRSTLLTTSSEAWERGKTCRGNSSSMSHFTPSGSCTNALVTEESSTLQSHGRRWNLVGTVKLSSWCSTSLSHHGLPEAGDDTIPHRQEVVPAQGITSAFRRLETRCRLPQGKHEALPRGAFSWPRPTRNPGQ